MAIGSKSCGSQLMAQHDMREFVHDDAVLSRRGLARIDHDQVLFANPHGKG